MIPLDMRLVALYCLGRTLLSSAIVLKNTIDHPDFATTLFFH